MRGPDKLPPSRLNFVLFKIFRAAADAAMFVLVLLKVDVMHEPDNVENLALEPINVPVNVPPESGKNPLGCGRFVSPEPFPTIADPVIVPLNVRFPSSSNAPKPKLVRAAVLSVKSAKFRPLSQ